MRQKILCFFFGHMWMPKWENNVMAKIECAWCFKTKVVSANDL